MAHLLAHPNNRLAGSRLVRLDHCSPPMGKPICFCISAENPSGTPSPESGTPEILGSQSPHSHLTLPSFSSRKTLKPRKFNFQTSSTPVLSISEISPGPRLWNSTESPILTSSKLTASSYANTRRNLLLAAPYGATSRAITRSSHHAATRAPTAKRPVQTANPHLSQPARRDQPGRGRNQVGKPTARPPKQGNSGAIETQRISVYPKSDRPPPIGHGYYAQDRDDARGSIGAHPPLEIGA